MKALVLSVFALMIVSMPVVASTGAEVGQTDAQVVASPSPDTSSYSVLEDFFAANGADVNAWGYWHCTAYPEGHGHSGGVDYRDVHYNHAYWGAVQGCERRWPGHHCHDVHCHYDHH